MNTFLRNILLIIRAILGITLTVGMVYYSANLLLPLTEDNFFFSNKLNLSMSILEEPKSASKNSFYAKILFFSILIIGIGYVAIELYKKASRMDSPSSPDSPIAPAAPTSPDSALLAELLLKDEMEDRAMAPWSGSNLNAEELRKALVWNRVAESQGVSQVVVSAAEIIEHSNLLVGMPPLRDHATMLSNVRNVEIYHERFCTASSFCPNLTLMTPAELKHFRQQSENVKAIDYFMSQKDPKVTTDFLYCERMSSL